MDERLKKQQEISNQRWERILKTGKEQLGNLEVNLRFLDDVGFLKSKNGKKKEILSIREACNKIIHAQSLQFVYGKTKDKMSYLKPRIHFTGEKNEKDWKATIDILKFVENAVNISNVYDETWDVSGYT